MLLKELDEMLDTSPILSYTPGIIYPWQQARPPSERADGCQEKGEGLAHHCQPGQGPEPGTQPP